jgi:CheY-like chemotaxis protein
MLDAATILVADDSPDDVELLRRAFERAGIDNPIECARDGQEVMQYLRNRASSGDGLPLLLLLDLNMPRCPGLGVLAWLRQEPHLPKLPTIVLSDSGIG